MKIEQLQQLIRIVEKGSINEAAKGLYVARSSLSAAIKILRRNWGSQFSTAIPLVSA